jgi:hypothetical protein
MSKRKRHPTEARSSTGRPIAAEVLEPDESDKEKVGADPTGPAPTTATASAEGEGRDRKRGRPLGAKTRHHTKRRVRIPVEALNAAAELPLKINAGVNLRFRGVVPIYDKDMLAEQHAAFVDMIGATDIDVPPWAAYLIATAGLIAFAQYVPVEKAEEKRAAGEVTRDGATTTEQPAPPPPADAGPGSRAAPAA